MFKKKKSLQKRKQIRRRDAEEDEDEDDTPNQLIREKKKRRQLLESAQYKRGISTTRLLSQSQEEIQNPGAGADDTDGDKKSPSEGVLERKHRQAMEEFIDQNLASKATPEEESEQKKGEISTTDELYAEIAESSRRLAGKATNSEQLPDADVGAGGALVAGTGLAEVVLPVEERLKTMEETVRATEELKRARKDDDSLKALPTANSKAASALPNRFAVLRAIPRMETLAGTDRESMSDAVADVDADRVGFEAFRHGDQSRHGPSTDGSSRNKPKSAQSAPRASDDRVYKKFVTKQRERQHNR